MKKKLGFYPGCSLEGTAREYNESVLSLANLFDIEFQSVPDWNCCGATAAHNTNKVLSLALAARILAQAEKAGITEIVVPCAACYSRLMVTQHELFENDALKAEVEQVIGGALNVPLRILNVIQFLQEYIMPVLPEKIKFSFDAKVACYYGCLLVRPAEILKFDREEDPQSMDLIMSAIGSEPVDWPFKTECCGAGLSVSRTSIVAKLSGKIIKEAAERGAKAVIVGCPMCHSNLDMRRNAIDKYLSVRNDIPVLYITQAIGIACGLNSVQTGTRRHFVNVDSGKFTTDLKLDINAVNVQK